jgi:hypothetical protein
MRFGFVFAAVLFCVVPMGMSQDKPKADSDGFVPLFNGKNFDDFVQQGGKAKYRIEDGVIIGESVDKTPNSFMCTKRLYRNFILEYEYKCDDRLNSGVQFRSNAYPIDQIEILEDGEKKIPKDRVHGYQVEIDPNKPDRMWSGGIYDEGRRGWLFPGKRGGDAKAFTEVGKKTYKAGEWNKVRIECNGQHIRTWLNDVARADFKDNLTAKGFIGLQVHGVGRDKEAIGKTVMWKNLKIKVLP